MKILRLRLKNLNSLVGEWAIDFQHPDYAQQGLFAITGPTGAGKSTILDAICLGLFGKTPRLANITKTDNEIMSRHTGDCFAEVTFEIDGTAYRSMWSQARAHRRAHGKLQEAKHELAEHGSGKIIEDKKSRTLAAIEQLTHLNFERFTRSVLLAQGSFAAFLQASADERADMLQQITGTDIYETISKQVHVNKRDADQKLQLLQAAINTVELLDEEAFAALQSDLSLSLSEQQQWQQQIEALQKTQQQQQQYELLVQAQQQWQQQWQAHRRAQQDFVPQQLRLQAAQKAMVLQADFAHITHFRQRQAETENHIEALQQTLPELAKRQDDALAQRDEAQQAHADLQQQTPAQQQLWQQVSALDAQLAQNHKIQQQHAEQQQQQRAQYQLKLAEKGQLDGLMADLNQKIEHVQQQLAQQDSLQKAEALLPKWQQKVQEIQLLQPVLQAQQQTAHSVWQALRQNQERQQDLASFFTQTAIRQQQLEQNVVQTNAEIDVLLAGKQLSEYELERDLLLQKQKLLHKIESLEQERTHLKDGDACPLCGAVSHPYIHSEHSMPSLSETDVRLAQLAQFFNDLGEQNKQAHQWQSNLTNLLQQLDIRRPEMGLLSQQIQKQVAEHTEKTNIYQATATNIEQLSAQLKQEWGMFAFNITDDLELTLHLLSKRIEHWQRYQHYLDQLQEEKALLLKDEVHLQAGIQQAQTHLHNIEQQSAQYVDEAALLQQQRHALLGEQTIAQAQSLWQQNLHDAQYIWQQQQHNWQLIHQEQQQAQQRLVDAQAQAQQLQTQYAKALADWQKLLQQHQFYDESQWQAVCLPHDAIKRLEQHQQQLAHTEIQLQQSRHQTEQALLALGTVAAQRADCEHTQDQLSQAQDTYQKHNQHIGSLQQQIKQQQEAQQKWAAYTEQWQIQQQDYQRWANLHDLIGSNDGNKYRRFAQSLTFNHLVQQANGQLQHMNERYLLKQSVDMPLHLDVIDQFQGGEIRSAKNLSGGESFIVSLALALGLARLSGHTTRIESLFLDEGFGTLDEDALEMALNALASLQQEGKTIGVISHVAALKERIATQIRVEPRQGGISVLQGNGITHTP